MPTQNPVLLDTSALLTHFLDEPGADIVESHLALGPDHAHVSAPTVVELERRLADLIREAAERDGILSHYCHQLCSVVSIDTAAAEASIRLRRQCRERLPMVDALIAGCAMLHGFVLVHRDDHLASIPKSILRQMHLPARGNARKATE